MCCISLLAFVARELSCSAPYPFVSQERGGCTPRRFPILLPLQVFRKAFARHAAGGHPEGSPSVEELEGENPRGGNRVKLRGGPPTIQAPFLRKTSFQNLSRETVMEKRSSWLFFWDVECQGCSKGMCLYCLKGYALCRRVLYIDR